jgi:RNA polymerase-binding transcription factor DksA
VAGLERDLAAIVESAALTPPDDEHDPEGSTIGFERALVTDLLSRARRDVADLNAALDRVDRAGYGTCARCGWAIPPERLAAHPTALTCVRCASAAVNPSRVRPTP